MQSGKSWATSGTWYENEARPSPWARKTFNIQHRTPNGGVAEIVWDQVAQGFNA